MDIKDTIGLYKSDSILLSDRNYYRYIFKKTEKIICSVFYVIGHTDKVHQDTVAISVLDSAKRTLDSALQTLACRWYTAYDELYVFLNTLVALESHIHVARATGLLQEEIADMLLLEIETVLRALQQYLAREKNSAPDLVSFTMSQPAPPVTPRAPHKGRPKGQHIERRRMIKDIIASKRQSTIKDISEKIPNYSEKVIQREIIAMITDGTIIKEGERRWSRYSLVAGA